jgi:hypothetical protein
MLLLTAGSSSKGATNTKVTRAVESRDEHSSIIVAVVHQCASEQADVRSLHSPQWVIIISLAFVTIVYSDI